MSDTAGNKLIVEPRVVELDVLDNVAKGLKFQAVAVKMGRHTVERLIRVSVDAGQVLILQVLANEFFFLSRCQLRMEPNSQALIQQKEEKCNGLLHMQ